jgi:ABC-type sugar transport system substrate-binding protein
MINRFKSTLLVGLLGLLGASAASAEDIKLRIASGHPSANTYVNLMQNFFVPEVTKRVALLKVTAAPWSRWPTRWKACSPA